MVSLSKMFAATATYPYQVVRSRLQVRTDQGLFDVIQNGAALPIQSFLDQRAFQEQWVMGYIAWLCRTSNQSRGGYQWRHGNPECVVFNC